MSCVSDRPEANAPRPYRRAGPPAAFRRRFPLVEAVLLALSIAACLALTAGMLG